MKKNMPEMQFHVVQVIDMPNPHDSILIITLFKCNKIHEPRFGVQAWFFFQIPQVGVLAKILNLIGNKWQLF